MTAPITADATVVFQLTVNDSGGDSDPDTVEIAITENGIIVDPSGMGAASSSSGLSSGGGGAGGCFIDTLSDNFKLYLF